MLPSEGTEHGVSSELLEGDPSGRPSPGEKYFKQYRFYSSSDNSFVPPVVFHDTKGTFCLNGSVHP